MIIRRRRNSGADNANGRRPSCFNAAAALVGIEFSDAGVDVRCDVLMVRPGDVKQRRSVLAIAEQRSGYVRAESPQAPEPQPEFPVFIAKPHSFVVACRPFPIFPSNQRGVCKNIAVQQAIEIVVLQSLNIVFGAKQRAVAVREGRVRLPGQHLSAGGDEVRFDPIVAIQRDDAGT